MSDAAVMKTHQSPVANVVLAMFLFLFTETMLFCGLISGYLVVRAQSYGLWPPEGQPRLPIEMTAFNTALLLGSGITMWAAIKAFRAGDKRKTGPLFLATLGLGGGFLLLQGTEWVTLLSHGLTLSSSVYGGFFYTIVGCHALHVIAALVVLGWVYSRFRRGMYTKERMDGLVAARIYWLFVVCIWPPLYGVVYLW